MTSTRAVLLFIAAQLCLVAEITAVHRLGPDFGLAQLTFLRALGMLAIILVSARGEGLRVLRSTRPGLQAVRAGLTVISLWAIFHSIAHLPLADASALSYLRPAFITLMAALLLRETVAARRWVATALGFLGALLVIGPAFAAWHPAYLVAVGGAALNGAAIVASKQLTAQDRPVTILAWLTLVSFLFSPTALAEPWPWAEWPALLAVATSGALALWLGLLAMRAADISLLAPFDYVRLPVLILVGVLVFAEMPSGATLAGSALILAAGGVLLLRERHRARILAAPALASVAKGLPAPGA